MQATRVQSEQVRPRKRVELEPWQARFYESTARYPCFLAGWGTGKTMCALLKGLFLSRVYAGNLGLIVRRVYKDLRDSTIKDYERYTHTTVPISSAETAFPNGSKIIFRHGDDLSGLQNVNLGWFYIEQAEEFESSDEFNMLRGRLRRELVVDPTYQPKPGSEYAALERYVVERQLRQGMVIANQAGHNWIWHDWVKQPQTDEFQCHQATTYDNARNLPTDFLADLDGMQRGNETARRKWRIYVNNESDELDLEGAYYAALIASARHDGHVCDVDYDPAVRVYTFWDFGFTDSTAIWFCQFQGETIRVIDYYENNGQPFSHYAKVIQDKGYLYGGHYAPHDVKQQDLKTGTSLLRLAETMGLHFEVVPDHDVQSRIEAARTVIPRCRFSRKLDDNGLDVLEHYRRKTNEVLSTEERTVFQDTPLHDWACFSGETKVLTRYGMYPIMHLPKEGEVYTPCGWKHYRNAGKTGTDAPLVAVQLNDGSTVKCTPEHMWLTDEGWTFAEHLTPHTVIRSCSTPSRNTSTVASTGYTLRRDILREVGESFTSRHGRRHLGCVHEDAISITATATLPTTRCPTLNAFPPANTSASPITRNSQRLRLATESTSPNWLERRRPNGTGLRLVVCGISDTRNDLRVGRSGSEHQSRVPSAENRSPLWYERVDVPRFTVPQPAKPLRIVNVTRLRNPSDVYCLTVDDGHCFCLENGAVVHNSHGADAWGYMAICYRFGTINGQYIGDSRMVAAYHGQEPKENRCDWDPLTV